VTESLGGGPCGPERSVGRGVAAQSEGQRVLPRWGPVRSRPGRESCRVPLTIAIFLDGLPWSTGRGRPWSMSRLAGSLGSITYTELHDRARGMALTLDSMGVGPGETGGHCQSQLPGGS